MLERDDAGAGAGVGTDGRTRTGADGGDDVMVRYQGVWKGFSGNGVVLAGVDLEVRRGEMLAVVGPSGTGKSVLLKTTIGLLEPDRGEVWVGDEAVVGGGPAARERIRRRVGYVFQNAALFDSLTVFENVAEGLSERELERIERRELRERVEAALRQVNLEPGLVLAKRPAELSGGMRKRVGLARAIIGRPEVLLYDEPVTGLDPVNGAIVHRLMARLSAELRVTSVVVTHDVEGALWVADRVALLSGGRIQFVGTAAEFQESRNAQVQAFLDREAALRWGLERLEADDAVDGWE